MGTWTHVERTESRQYSLSDRWGEQTIQLVYLSYWTPTNNADPFPGEASLLTNAPAKPQTRLPSGIYGTPVNAFLSRFVCRNVSIEPSRERPYAYTVRATFTTYSYPYADTPWGLEYVKQTRTSTFRTMSMYRLVSTPPTNGDVSWPSGVTDIGGTKVDINGNPRPFKVGQAAIQVELLVDRAPATSITPQFTAQDPAWGTLYGFLNKRNSATFLGYGIGTVLCNGITASLDSEWWRVQVSFLVDDSYHLEQVPIPNQTGAARLRPGVTIAGEQINQVEKVGWYQPYMATKVDFATMFTSSVSDQFGKAGPERPV
jgi:hypothetical protein